MSYEFKEQPHVVAVREVKKSKQASASKDYIYSVNELATSKKKQHIKVITKDKLPELLDQGDNLTFYSFPITLLDKLLGMAKSPSDCIKITTDDLIYVVKCCDYRNIFKFAYAETLAKKAIKILSYMAENERKLSDAAILALIIEFNKNNDKTNNNVLLALCYVINNGQELAIDVVEKLEKKLKEHIAHFKDKNKLLQNPELLLLLPMILVGIAAMAMLERELSQVDLALLENALIYVNGIEHPYYTKTNANLTSHPTNKMGINLTTFQTLKTIKYIARDHGFLSRDEIKYCGQKWDKADEDIKSKVIQILKYISVNGQRNFIEEKPLFTSMIEGLEENNRKIKNNAIIAANFIIHSKGNTKETQIYTDQLSEVVNKALTHQRKYALRALNHHVARHKDNQIVDKSKLLERIEQIEKKHDENEKVRGSATLLLSLIKDNVGMLAHFLLKESYCAQTVITLANAAQQKLKICPHTLENLEKLISGQCDFTISDKTKYNAISVIGLAIDNGQDIAKSLFDILMGEAKSNNNKDILNIIITVVECAVNKNHFSYLSIDVMTILSKMLMDKELSQNTCSVLTDILQKIEKNLYIVQFVQIFDLASTILNSNGYDSECRRNALILLMHAAKKGYHLNEKVISSLAQVLSNSQNEIKANVLHTLWAVISNAQNIILSKVILKRLIQLLNDDDFVIRNNVSVLLCLYIEKCNPVIDQITIKSLTDLISVTKYHCEVINVYASLSRKKYQLDIHCLEEISKLVNSQDSHVKRHVGFILNENVHTSNDIYTEQIIYNLIVLLNNQEENVIHYALSCLKEVLERQSRIGKTIKIPNESYIQLASMIEDQHNEINIRIHAAHILNYQAEFGEIFNIQTLDILHRSLDEIKLTKVILRIIRAHFKNIKFNSSNNKSMILDGILKSITEIINDDEVILTEILVTLNQANVSNYELPISIFDIITEIIISHKSDRIRNEALSIINNISTQLPEKTYLIKQLECNGSIVSNPKEIPRDKIYQAAEYICAASKNGQILTINNLKMLESNINIIDRKLQEIILTIIYYEAKNRHDLPILPDELVQKFSKQLHLSVIGKNQHVILALIQVIIKGQYVEDNVIDYFQTLFVETAGYEKELILVFEVAIAANKTIHRATIDKLEDLLTHHDINMQKQTSKLLYLLVRNKPQIQISQDKLSAALKSNIDEEVQKNIFSALEKNSENHHIPPQLNIILYIKQQQEIVKNVNATDELLIKAIKYVLSKPEYITKNVLESVSILLEMKNHIIQGAILNNIIKQLGTIKLPDSVLRISIKLMLKCDNSSFNNDVQLFIWSVIRLKTFFPADVIDDLFDEMLWNKNSLVRDAAFKILFSIKEYHDFNNGQNRLILQEEIGQSVQSDANYSKFEIENYLTQIVNNQLPLSLNNFSNICYLLEIRNEIHLNRIIDILSKFIINDRYAPMYLDVLTKLVIILDIKSVDSHKVDLIFLKIIKSELLQPSKIDNLIQLLTSQILSKGVNYSRTNLLEELIRLSPGTLYDYMPKLIDILVKSMRSSADVKTNDSTILLISVLVMQYKNLPNSVLVTLNQFELLGKSCLKINGVVINNSKGMVNNAYNSVYRGIDNLLIYVGCKYPEQNYSLFTQVHIFKLLNYISRIEPSFIKNPKEVIDWAFVYLSNVYDIKDDYLKSFKQFDKLDNQLYILLSLISRDRNYFRIDIIRNNVSGESLAREMLCNELLSIAEEISDDESSFLEEVQTFWNCLSNLEDHKGYKKFNIERDYILEFLIDKMVRENLSLFDINQILIMLEKHQKAPLEILEKKYEDIITDWLTYSFQDVLGVENVDDTILKGVENIFRELLWDVEYIDYFFKQLRNVKKINEIHEFLLFLKEQEISIDLYDEILSEQLENDEANSVAYWKDVLIDITMAKKIQSIVDLLIFIPDSESNQLSYKQQILKTRVNQLMKLGWSFEKLFKFFEELELIVNEEGIIAFERVFDAISIAYCYELSEHEFYEIDINNLHHFNLHKFHQKAVFKYVKNTTQIRDPDSLLDEFKSKNVDEHKYNLNFDNAKFLKLLSAIKLLYETGATLKSGYPSKSAIRTWNESDIRSWAEFIKKCPHKLKYAEVFSVLKRACYLHTKKHEPYEPRIAQLLALYTLLKAHNSQDKSALVIKGRLAQINTGEGKSCIDAMHAIIRVLQGRKVEIITTNSLLAKGEVEEYRDFYKLFNIKIDCNEDEKYETGPKNCYKDEVAVVYGDISNYQYDYLNDQLLKTRAGREFDFVIVDEVDNLLIDEGAKIAMLSTTIPGMDYLEPLLLLIWQELLRIGSFIFKSEGQWFYRDESELIDGKPVQRIIPNLEQFICPKLDIFIKKAVEEKNGKRDFNIPKHLEKFVDKQISKWLHSAYLAYFVYKPERHYDIKLNKKREKIISPVDFANTGVTQNGTTWGDGLHQFLQIKHGLNLTSENLTTNYISNMEYIKKYKNISGVTGTLGSQNAKELLSNPNMYPIDFAYIPTFKTKQFHEIKGIIADSEDIWLHEILISIIREAQNGRVALVICETIEQAKYLYKIIRSCFSGNVKQYFDSDANTNHFVKDDLEGNSIVVATNLGGRGTDLKLSRSVVQAGGLHTCITYLPSNERIEDQAFGRGSRKGEPGTGQLILNRNDLIEKLKNVLPGGKLESDDFAYIKKIRNEHEKNHLKHVANHELPLTKKKDDLFVKYRELVKQFDTIDSKLQSTIDKEHKRSAVEERWGLWLKEHDITNDAIFEQFENFKESILKEYENDTVIKNPCYFINHGNDMLTRANSWKEKIKNMHFFGLYDQALFAFDEAIKLDSEHAYLAYYNRAYATLNKCVGNDKEYKENAKADLIKCIKIISENILPQLDYVLEIMNQSGWFTKELVERALTQQISSKTQILRLLINSAQQAILRIERSQKLIDITYENKTESTTYTKLRKDQASNLLSTSSHQNITLSFHDLNTFTDTFRTNYQSLNTLSYVKGSSINIIYESKNIRSGEDVKKVFKNLLPINKDSAEEAKKIQESANEKQELIAFEEKFSAFKDSATNTALNLYKTVTNVAATVASPMSKGLDKATEFWHNFKIAKELSVNLSMDCLKIGQAKTIMNKLAEYHTNVNMIITHICEDDINIVRSSSLGKQLLINSCSFTDNRNGKFIINKMSNNGTKKPQADYYEVILKDISIAETNNVLALLDKEKNSSLPSNLLNFKFELNNIQQVNANKIIEFTEGDLTLSFNNLDHRKADSVVYFTKTYNNDAIYQITHLKKQEVENLIVNADRSEEDVSVTLKTLESEFKKISDQSNEVSVFNDDGLMYLFDVKELNPMPWVSIVFVTVLGVAQIAVGFALAACTMGFGANFGISLMAEGVSDLIKAVSIAYTREFSLSSFITQKTLSIAMSLATAGWSTFQMSREAARAAKAAAMGLDLADDIAIKTGGLFANAVGANAAKNSAKVVTRQLIATTLETGASEATSNILEKVSQFTIDQMRPKIIADISKGLKTQFNNGAWKRILTKIFAIDKFMKNNSYILNAYQELIYIEAERIIGNSKFDIMGFKGIKLSPTSEFIEKFTKVLRKIEKDELPSTAELIYQGIKFTINMTREEVNKIYNLLVEQKIISSSGKIIRQALHSKEIDLKEHNKFQSDVIETCEELIDMFDDDYFIEHNHLCQSITELITDQVCDSIESATLPVKKGIGYGINCGVCALTNSIKNPKSCTGDVPNATEDTGAKESSSKNSSNKLEPSANGQSEVVNLNEPTNVNIHAPSSAEMIEGTSGRNSAVTTDGGNIDSFASGSRDPQNGAEPAYPSRDRKPTGNNDSSKGNNGVNGVEASDTHQQASNDARSGKKRDRNHKKSNQAKDNGRSHENVATNDGEGSGNQRQGDYDARNGRKHRWRQREKDAATGNSRSKEKSAINDSGIKDSQQRSGNGAISEGNQYWRNKERNHGKDSSRSNGIPAITTDAGTSGSQQQVGDGINGGRRQRWRNIVRNHGKDSSRSNGVPATTTDAGTSGSQQQVGDGINGGRRQKCQRRNRNNGINDNSFNRHNSADSTEINEIPQSIRNDEKGGRRQRRYDQEHRHNSANTEKILTSNDPVINSPVPSDLKSPIKNGRDNKLLNGGGREENRMRDTADLQSSTAHPPENDLREMIDRRSDILLHDQSTFISAKESYARDRNPHSSNIKNENRLEVINNRIRQNANQSSAVKNQSNELLQNKQGNKDLLRKIIFGAAVSGTQEFLFNIYQKALKQNNAQNLYTLKIKYINYLKSRKEINDKVIFEEIEFAKMLIGMIIVEKKYGIELDKLMKEQNDPDAINLNSNVYLKEVQTITENIFMKSIKVPRQGYEIILNELNNLYPDLRDVSELLTELKYAFYIINQYLGDHVMQEALTGLIKKAATDVNYGEVATGFLTQLDKKNYSQCALLLKENKLGEGGFLAGTMIEGLIKCNLASTEAHSKISLLLIQTANAALESHNKFCADIVLIEKERQAVYKAILSKIYEKLEKAEKSLERAFEDKDYKSLKLAELHIELIKTGLDAVKSVSASFGVNQDFSEKCIAASVSVINTLMSAVKEICRQDNSALKDLTSMAKECVTKYLESKPKDPAPQQPAAAQIQQNQVPLLQQAPGNGGVQPNGGQAPQLNNSVPSWKVDFDKADKDYAEGKTKYRFKNNEAAYTLFQQARTKYKAIADDAKSDVNANRKIQKRLGKLKDPDGKYSPSKLSP